MTFSDHGMTGDAISVEILIELPGLPVIVKTVMARQLKTRLQMAAGIVRQNVVRPICGLTTIVMPVFDQIATSIQTILEGYQ